VLEPEGGFQLQRRGRRDAEEDPAAPGHA
jgi:hypothetical protein